MPSAKGFVITSGDLKSMIIPLFFALVRTFGRLHEDKVLEIAKDVKRRKTLISKRDISAGNVGSE